MTIFRNNLNLDNCLNLEERTGIRWSAIETVMVNTIGLAGNAPRAIFPNTGPFFELIPNTIFKIREIRVRLNASSFGGFSSKLALRNLSIGIDVATSTNTILLPV